MTIETFAPGDIVRVVENPFWNSTFSKKVANRGGVVEFVGPDKHGQFKNQMWVRFLKRNGRGKEFRELMFCRDCVKVTA